MVNRRKADTWSTYSTRRGFLFFCYRDIFFRFLFFFFFFGSIGSVKDIYSTGDLRILCTTIYRLMVNGGNSSTGNVLLTRVTWMKRDDHF